MPEIKFKREYITGELKKIGSTLRQRVKVLLIGGCIMIFRDLKDVTKDVDMVLTSPNDLKAVVEALKSLEYSEIKELPREYQKLGASAVLRNPDGFQIDVFHRQVCEGLEITERMEGRAHFLKTFGNLDVYLMSAEDVFIFKSITEREADLVDMRALAEVGVDWGVVKEECMFQKKRSIWEAFLVDRLEELKSRFGIEVPITKELRKVAEDEMIKRILMDIIKDGNDTVDKIAKVVKEKSRYSESWTRRQLNGLVKNNMIERVGRCYKYFVAPPK